MDDNDEILARRAEELARETPSESPDRARLDVALFELANEIHAIELACIKEIYPLRDLTPVPHTPDFIAGIVNFRGQILSVVDLRKFFDLPGDGVADSDRIVVLESQAMTFGILANAVREAGSVYLNDLRSDLPTLTDIRARYLKGVTRDGIVVLDGNKLLNDENMIVE